MKTKIEWTVSDITNAKSLGEMEFQSEDGEFHSFHVLKTDTRIVFGGACNVGFLESGYIALDLSLCDWEQMEEAYNTLLNELQSYYDEGQPCEQVVHNERM